MIRTYCFKDYSSKQEGPVCCGEAAPCDEEHRYPVPASIREAFPPEVVRRIETHVKGIELFKNNEGVEYTFEWTPSYIKWFKESNDFELNYEVVGTLERALNFIGPDFSLIERLDYPDHRWVGLYEFYERICQVYVCTELFMENKQITEQYLLEVAKDYPWPEDIILADKEEFEDIIQNYVTRYNKRCSEKKG